MMAVMEKIYIGQKKFRAIFLEKVHYRYVLYDSKWFKTRKKQRLSDNIFLGLCNFLRIGCWIQQPWHTKISEQYQNNFFRKKFITNMSHLIQNGSKHVKIIVSQAMFFSSTSHHFLSIFTIGKNSLVIYFLYTVL